MAITHIGADTEAASGPYSGLTTVTLALPAGTQAGDVLHIAAGIMAPNVLEAIYPRIIVVRAYSFAIPPGWHLMLSSGPRLLAEVPHVTILRKVASPADVALGTVTLPITRIIHDTRVPVADDHLDVIASITSHRGVAPYQWIGPFEFQLRGAESFTSAPGGGGGTMPAPPAPPTADGVGSVALQFSFLTKSNLANAAQVPAVTSPVPTVPTSVTSQPDEWTVLSQDSTLAPAAAGSAFRGVALEATDLPDPGQILRATAPGVNEDHHGNVITVMYDVANTDPVDPPPAPGQPGVTGSGWLIPEWDGRARQISTPLRCTVLAEGVGEYGPELVILLDEDSAPEPVALDANFNGLGACTTAVAYFAAPPGFVPFQHALRFGLRTTDLDENDPSVTWWTGTVTNVRHENGLYLVDLDGFWSLLNEARVTLEPIDPDDSGSDMQVGTPDLEGVILDVLILNHGDSRTREIFTPADEQQPWGEHLNDAFRETPSAAWGIGPDQTFIMGLPENGGVLTVDSHDAVIVTVTGGEFLLPPFVTEWWAQTAAGPIVSGQGIPRGLLTPSRVMQAQLDPDENLLVPKEALFLSYEGPSHVIEVAGIAVPPLQIMTLPNGGSQLVASARVQVTLGEEGSMPRVTTTLTTVALPFVGGR